MAISEETKAKIQEMCEFVASGRRKQVAHLGRQIVHDLTEYNGKPNHVMAATCIDAHGETRFADGYEQAVKDVLSLLAES